MVEPWFTLWIVCLSLKGVVTDCPNKCTCYASVLECYKVMPTFIPQSITEVIIYENQQENKLNFTSLGWMNVTKLSINPGLSTIHTNLEEPMVIHNNQFSMLKNIESLQIAFAHLREIQKHAFYGLNKLKVLDLSNNQLLSMDSVVHALNGDGILPNLTELYLSSTSIQNPDLTVSSEQFQNAIKDKPIKVFDISNFRSAWFLGEIDILTVLPFLEKLNISNSSINIFSLHALYNINMSTNLKILDVSYSTFFMPFNNYGKYFMMDLYTEYLKPLNLTELHAKKLLNYPTGIKGTANKTHVCLEVVFNNGSKKDCVETNVGHLKKFVISENSLNYIEPRIWKGFESLRYLDIGNNNLGEAFSNNGYARSIFDFLRNLEFFIASRNGISEIPEDTFRSGKSLKILDLSWNSLKSVMFETHYLFSLQKLDISNNNILYLDESGLGRLTHLLHGTDTNEAHDVEEQSNGLQINMNGNPFDCSCTTAPFLYWLITLNETNTCIYSSKEKQIDRVFIQEIEYHCKEKIVIAVYSVLSLALVVTLATMTILIIRERRKLTLRNQIKKGIAKFDGQEHKEENPPVFLSFCSEDDDVVMNDILPNLDAGLKKILNTEMRCVSNGYQDLRPGFSLANEIIRCVEASSVVIFFVTNAFCRKMWCRNEALVAHYDNKPAVLMMWEKVDVTAMPKHLYKHYQEYVRVHWVQEGEERVMKPGWDELCEAVVRLFADK